MGTFIHMFCDMHCMYAGSMHECIIVETPLPVFCIRLNQQKGFSIAFFCLALTSSVQYTVPNFIVHKQLITLYAHNVYTLSFYYPLLCEIGPFQS